jgi:hypothetical protein
MQRYTVYLYLETALHVSGGTSIHHQERIQLYLQHLVFFTPSLLSAAIVEELEPVWVCCGWRKPVGNRQPKTYVKPEDAITVFAADTVVCAPDDGWKYHPKHVDQFPDINKLCNVASCWIYEYIGIRLGAHPILHNSRIKVNRHYHSHLDRTDNGPSPLPDVTEAEILVFLARTLQTVHRIETRW